MPPIRVEKAGEIILNISALSTSLAKHKAYDHSQYRDAQGGAYHERDVQRQLVPCVRRWLLGSGYQLSGHFFSRSSASLYP